MLITGNPYYAVNQKSEKTANQKDTAEKEAELNADNNDFKEKFQNKIEEMHKKSKYGTSEPSFMIGSRSFTLKEWDRFLERFDAAGLGKGRK